jgi:hypothetical protein
LVSNIQGGTQTENRVLRRIFGPKSDEVTGGWRKLHNGELCNLYSPPSTIRMIKSRRIRGAENEACMVENRNIQVIGRNARKKETARKAKT